MLYSFTEIDVKFPQMTKHFLARVRATFRRCAFARNPMPVVLVVHNIMMSFSCPWYESIVLTGILCFDNSCEALFTTK